MPCNPSYLFLYPARLGAMDVRRMLLLRTVAEHGSISAAARAAGWTQPALSQHIRALEAEVGQPLLIRSTAGVRLTEAGEILVAHADGIASHLMAATQQLSDLSTLTRSRLRIAAFPSAVSGLLPPVLSSLRHEIAHLDLQLTEAEPPEATEMLLRNDVDVAIVFHYADAPGEPGESGDGDLLWIPWCDDSIRLVSPASASARSAIGVAPLGESGSIADYADAPWIAGCERCQRHLSRVALRAGFTPAIWHETDDAASTQALVAAGHGVALLPSTALGSAPHSGVAVESLDGLGTRRIGALVRRAVTGIPVVRRFLMLPGGPGRARPDRVG